MNVLIVLAHSEPTSFSTALTQRAQQALTDAGHQVTISDLYADGFNPVASRADFTTVADRTRFQLQAEQAHAAKHDGFAPDIQREQARLKAADLVILQFPLWWGGPPAILKGWFERVLAYGVAYADGLRYSRGVFQGRRAMVSVTTGGTPQRFGPDQNYGTIEQVLWQPQQLAMAYMGFEIEEPFVAYAAPRVGDEGRAEYLDAFARRVVEAASRPVDRSLAIEDPLKGMAEAAWARNK